MYTKVVGVTYKNDDRTSRQAILKRMEKTTRRGDPIELRREPDNPYDKYAIAVYNKDGEQLGYINKETAREYAEYIDTGERVTAEVDKIIGGGLMRSYGCIIDLAVNGVRAPDGCTWDRHSKWDKSSAGPSVGKIVLGLFLLYLTLCGSPFGVPGLIIFIGDCLIKYFKPDKISLYRKCVAGVILLLFVIGMILSMTSN